MSGVLQAWAFPHRAMDGARELARMVNFPEHFELVRGATLFDVLGAVKKYSLGLAYLNNIEGLQRMAVSTHNPVFLGRSSKPVLTKQRFISLRKQDVPLEEIQEKYRGWENKPLAWWQAHVTMGTYDKIPDDNGDIERISWQEAVGLAQEGIPPEEIFEAYPTSFSKGQRRALKAHVTMGTYAKK